MYHLKTMYFINKVMYIKCRYIWSNENALRYKDTNEEKLIYISSFISKNILSLQMKTYLVILKYLSFMKKNTTFNQSSKLHSPASNNYHISIKSMIISFSEYISTLIQSELFLYTKQQMPLWKTYLIIFILNSYSSSS